MTNETALQAWVISDGRRGIENQAWGLAEAASVLRSLEIEKHVLEPRRTFRTLPPLMQYSLQSAPTDYGLPTILPDIAIGCGRQAIAPLLAIKKADPQCFTVYVQDPKIDPAKFDLVIAPEHDDLSGDNVEPMIGSPHRITRDRIVKETLAFEKRLITLPMPRAAFLIGGPSKTYQFTQADHENHIAAIKDVAARGYSVLITLSRRTPDWAIETYHSLSDTLPHLWLHKDGDDNPYFAFLGGADIIFVTSDSTNMLTESCATGKPVFRLPLSGKPRKFRKLYDALEAHCELSLYNGNPDAPDYPPLKETERVAEKLWAHFDRRQAVIN
jgi:mitochondrial fission protein ELM1